jgi:hypothetical protein
VTAAVLVHQIRAADQSLVHSGDQGQ